MIEISNAQDQSSRQNQESEQLLSRRDVARFSGFLVALFGAVELSIGVVSLIKANPDKAREAFIVGLASAIISIGTLIKFQTSHERVNLSTPVQHYADSVDQV